MCDGLTSSNVILPALLLPIATSKKTRLRSLPAMTEQMRRCDLAGNTVLVLVMRRIEDEVLAAVIAVIHVFLKN